jgi:hypothetical protein
MRGEACGSAAASSWVVFDTKITKITKNAKNAKAPLARQLTLWRAKAARDA